MLRRSGHHLHRRTRHDAVGEPDLAGQHRLEPGEAAQHRGLAAARRPEQAADAARFEREVHAPDDLVRAIRVLERADGDGGGHARGRRPVQPARERHGAARGGAAGAALAQRLHLVGHRLADEDLRIRRRRVAFAALALADADLGQLERGVDAVGLREALLKERLAEERGRAVVLAAERRAIGLRRRHDHRVVVLQRPDEATGVAGGHDDDPPLDPGIVQQLLQSGGREFHQRQRPLVGRKLVIRAAVAHEVQHHHVVFGIDDRADLVQRLAQVGDGGEGSGEERPRIVEQHHRPAVGAPARIHHLLRRLDVLAEDIAAAIRRKADEVEIGQARPLVRQAVERVVEQEGLLGQHGFRPGRHAGFARRRVLLRPATTARSGRVRWRTRSARRAAGRRRSRAATRRTAAARTRPRPSGSAG